MLPFGGNIKGDEVKKKIKKATGGLGNSNYAINHTGSLNSERVASTIKGDTWREV